MIRENETYCSKAPEMIEIDTSNVCNLKCVTCMRARRDYLQEKPEFLGLGSFRIILSKIPQLNIVQFCGSSEPTLNKELPDMIDYAKDRGAKIVETFTNGGVLVGDMLERLSNSKLDRLKVSVDGGDEETYRLVRGFSLAKVTENIKNFHRKSPIPIGVESVISKYTIGSIGKLPDVVMAMGGSSLNIRLLNWVDPNLKRDFVYDLGQLTKIRSSLGKICGERGIQLTMSLPNDGSCNVCTAFTELYVDYRGDVTPCYFLNRMRLGSLVKGSLESVWNGDGIRMYRKNYLGSTAAPECCCSRGLLINKKVKSNE